MKWKTNNTPLLGREIDFMNVEWTEIKKKILFLQFWWTSARRAAKQLYCTTEDLAFLQPNSTTFLSHRAWSVYSSRIPKLRLIINLDFQDTLSFPPDAPTHLKANGTMHQQTITKNQLQAGCSLGRASTLKVNKMKEVLNSKNAPSVYYMGVLLVEFPGVE